MESSWPSAGEVSGGRSDGGPGAPNERLGFEVGPSRAEEAKENGVGRRWRWRFCGRRAEFGTAAAVGSADGMRFSRSCRCGVSGPVMLWTTVCLILLAGGVSCVREEQTRMSRSPRYEGETEVPGGMSAQETYNVMQFLRELIQRQKQRASQHSGQPYSADELSDRDIDWRKVPLPLLYQIRALISDGSKEEDKRGSYMSLCHFKICNLG